MGYNVSKKDFVKGLVEVLYFLLLDWDQTIGTLLIHDTQFNISNIFHICYFTSK